MVLIHLRLGRQWCSRIDVGQASAAERALGAIALRLGSQKHSRKPPRCHRIQAASVPPPPLGRRRILRVKMTDGRSSCVGIEYSPMPAIKTEQLVPGTKVVVRGCTLRVGVLLLDAKCFTVGAIM